MIELKKHVEKIVRPIRATQARKNRMREELLGHLMTSHDSALRAGAPDPVADAISGLGEVEALRAELQSTVPRLEETANRVCVFRYFDLLEVHGDIHRKDTLRIAAETAVGFPVSLCLFCSPFFLAALAVRMWRHDTINWSAAPSSAITVLLMLLSMTVAIFCVTLMFRSLGLHRFMHKSSGLPALLKMTLGVAAYMVMMLLFGAGLFVVDMFWELGGRGITLAKAISVVSHEPRVYFTVALAMLVTTYGMAKERQQYLEWGCLDIDE